MDRGSIAIVDALGFKGVWGAPDKPTTKVLESLKRVGAAAREEATRAAKTLGPRSVPPLLRKLLKKPFVRVVQLSDTIVVAAGYRPRERALWKRDREKWKTEYGLDFSVVEGIFDSHLRELVCSCVCMTMKIAALCDPPLVYRGVVTAGSFAIDETFILGPAVDEAAELMSLADGAFVWLAPSAMRIGAKANKDEQEAWWDMAVRYRVPLKGGQRIRTRALNPFVFCTPADRKKVERSILRRMDGSGLDVVVKKQNTGEFFQSIGSRERMKERAEARQKDGDGKSA